MSAFDDVLAGNAAYAATFDDQGKPGKAATGLCLVTCMDSRIDPLRMLGLQRGDAKVIRNAGARVTDDVLNTLVLATTLLGVDRVLVAQHTSCAMTGKGEADVQQLLSEQHGLDVRSLQFGVMPDQRAALARDVQKIRSWPYLPQGLTVAGGLYDVVSGRLEIVVPEA